MKRPAFFPGSETITASNHKATASYAGQRQWLSQFNNLVIEGRDARGWIVRAADFDAECVAREGAFDVTRIEGDRFAVKRHYPFTIVDDAAPPPVAAVAPVAASCEADVDLLALLAATA